MCHGRQRGSADNGNVDTPIRYTMRRADTAHKDVILSIDLRAGDDNLRTLTVIGVRDGVIQKTNASDHQTRGPDLLTRKVRWITNDQFRFGHFISTANTVSFTRFIH